MAKISPESMARASSRHPWRTLGLWVVLIMSMGIVSSNLLAGVLSQNISFTNKPESVQAQDILDKKFPGTRCVEAPSGPGERSAGGIRGPGADARAARADAQRDRGERPGDGGLRTGTEPAAGGNERAQRVRPRHLEDHLGERPGILGRD